MSLGIYGVDCTAEQARDRARGILKSVREGDDPARVAADKISSRIAGALAIAHEEVGE